MGNHQNTWMALYRLQRMYVFPKIEILNLDISEIGKLLGPFQPQILWTKKYNSLP